MKTDMRGAPERRSLSLPLEMRAGKGNEVRLTGYASVFDNEYPIMGGPPYGFNEIVDPRAFDATLKGKPDVHLLINHAGMPLARTKSGTLQLGTDSKGFLVDASLDRRDPEVQALEIKMERGDIDEMSFAFRTIRDLWNHDESQRRLMEVSVDKGDVSVVNFGANPATSTSLERALRALSSAPVSALTQIRGADLVGAQKTIARMLAREAAMKTTRAPMPMPAAGMAMDPETLCGLLMQAMGWLTAIDNIADGIAEGDPEYAGADLSTLIIAIDAIADEGAEAIATALGLPSPDPDDVDGDEPPVRMLGKPEPALTASHQAIANARAYNRAQPRIKSMSVKDALASC